MPNREGPTAPATAGAGRRRGLEAAVTDRPIAPGDVLHLTRAASPQFVKPITVRVIREVKGRHTYHGWTWIEAYELDAGGDAVAKRELFVLHEGLHRLAVALRQAAPARGTSPTRVR